MYRNSCFLILLTAILISCHSHEIVPDFKIGQGETVWRSNIQNALNTGTLKILDTDDTLRTLYSYSWKIGDTTIPVRISFNGDGLPYGKLRIILLEIIHPKDNTVASHANSDSSKSPLDKFDMELYDRIDSQRCPVVLFDQILSTMKKKYGQLDSVVYESNPLNIFGIDTIGWQYNFHEGNTRLVLNHGKVHLPDSLPQYYRQVQLYQVSATYEQDLLAEIDLKRPKSPQEIIEVRIGNDIVTEKDEFGNSKTYIKWQFDIYPGLLKSLAEQKPIRSIKGDFMFLNPFNDTLQIFHNISIDLDAPLENGHKPGLRYASYGNSAYLSKGSTYRSDKYEVFQKSNSTELQNAVRQGQKIKILFNPTAILFTDGSILK